MPGSHLPRSAAPALLAAVACLLPAADALAQAAYIKGPLPTDRVYYRNTTVLRANPIGLMNEFRFGYRHRLFNSESPLLKNAFAGVQAIPFLSPAFSRLGLAAELAPLSILQFTAQYEFLGAFGKFGTIQSFESANSDASGTHIIGPIPQSTNYANTGHQFTLAMLLQAKVPSSLTEPGLIVRNNTRLMNVRQDLSGGGPNDRVYYDLVFDLVAPNNGWFAVNDLDVLYMFSPKLTAGLRYTASLAFYGSEHVLPGEAIPNNDTHRLGPLISYSFFTEDGERFNTPTLFCVINWHLKHPYRTGQDDGVSQAIPYFVLGFSFTGDLAVYR
jgi:hypothetical protein